MRSPCRPRPAYQLNTGLAGKAASGHNHQATQVYLNEEKFFTTYYENSLMLNAPGGRAEDYLENISFSIGNLGSNLNKAIDAIPLQTYISGINVVPQAINTEYAYTDQALKGKKCVIAIFYSSVGNVFVTSHATSRGVLNVKDGDQYWGGEVAIAFDTNTGTVKFTVKWIGSSQQLGNFALTGIQY